MLTERIVGALTFRRGAYAEVEADKTFTQTARIKDHHHRHDRVYSLGDHHDSHRRRFFPARSIGDRDWQLAQIVGSGRRDRRPTS